MLQRDLLVVRKKPMLCMVRRAEPRPTVLHLWGAVVISNPTSAQPQRDNARNQNAPRRQFTKINMPLSQALQHMLKAELITLRDPPQNVNTSSPRYNPNA